MTVYVGGNSHCGALKLGMPLVKGADEALTVNAFGGNTLEAEPFSEIRDGRVEFTSRPYAKTLQSFTGKGYFDSDDIWGICQGTHYNRFLKNPLWRGPAAPSAIATPKQRPISDGVLDAIIEADQAHVRTFIGQLKKTGVPVFAVSCAPVRRDGSAAGLGVPPEVILAISSRARDQFLAWLEAHDIAFVGPPPETMDADGFLLPEYCQGMIEKLGLPDPVHANAAYGALMVQRIMDHVKTMAV
ncbi:MAG: hypothetical protein ACOH2H_18495 [Cypionkella sp.]